MGKERNEKLANGMLQYASDKDISIVGICAFGIMRGPQGNTVDSIVVFPHPRELVDAGTDKERTKVALRFVKLIAESSKMFLHRVFEAFDVPVDERSTGQVDEVIRKELESLRVVRVSEGDKS
jgi:hypothetical protein